MVVLGSQVIIANPPTQHKQKRYILRSGIGDYTPCCVRGKPHGQNTLSLRLSTTARPRVPIHYRFNPEMHDI
jgi:hypothetical protein